MTKGWLRRVKVIVGILVMGMGPELLVASSEPEKTTIVPIAQRAPELVKQIGDALWSKGVEYKPRTEHLKPDGAPLYTNRLILEDSPYLIQHAHNPVDWHPWGDEAFARAKREGKPIFLWEMDGHPLGCT